MMRMVRMLRNVRFPAEGAEREYARELVRRLGGAHALARAMIVPCDSPDALVENYATHCALLCDVLSLYERDEMSERDERGGPRTHGGLIDASVQRWEGKPQAGCCAASSSTERR